jgi:hypothetical protein
LWLLEVENDKATTWGQSLSPFSDDLVKFGHESDLYDRILSDEVSFLFLKFLFIDLSPGIALLKDVKRSVRRTGPSLA